jgi:amino acid transporter
MTALAREVSRRQLVGLAINDVVGSGVYLLPAATAALLGPSSLFIILLTGVAVALLVLCFAAAASYFEEPGGAYVYTREAFGPFVGFEVGFMTWLARIASMASLANAFALAVAFFWPGAAAGTPRAAIIVALLGLLTWFNVVGVKHGARVAVALVITKVLPLALFVVVGLFFVEWPRIVPSEPPDLAALGEASLLMLFAYAGFENTGATAGEHRNPRRDVPFALVTMIVGVTVLYAGVQLVALGTVPELATSTSAVAEASRTFMGPAGAVLMSVAALLSIAGNLSSTVLAGPRYLYALAKDGYGPHILARVHPRFRTPHVAIVFLVSIALILALTGSFAELAMLSVVARLVTYVGTAAAVPVLRKQHAGRPGVLELPGGLTIPALAFALSLTFLATAEFADLAAGAAALGVGALIYLLRRSRPDRGGSL